MLHHSSPICLTIYTSLLADANPGLEIETNASGKKKKKRKHRKIKGSKGSVPMTEEEEEAAMQDEVGTLKEQIAALRQQMRSNDALLSGIEEEDSDGADATMNGAGKRDDHASDSESTTSSRDNDNQVVKKKQTARTPRPPSPSQGEATDDDGIMSGGGDSLDVPDTVSTRRTKPKVAAESATEPKKNNKSASTAKKAKKKKKTKKQAETLGEGTRDASAESPQKDGVSAPEVAETVRNILRTPGPDSNADDEGAPAPAKGGQLSKKSGKAASKKVKKKKKAKKKPAAVMPDPNATPILEDPAEVHAKHYCTPSLIAEFVLVHSYISKSAAADRCLCAGAGVWSWTAVVLGR